MLRILVASLLACVGTALVETVGRELRELRSLHSSVESSGATLPLLRRIGHPFCPNVLSVGSSLRLLRKLW